MSRYTKEQIAFSLRQAKAGPPVADVCRQMGVGEANFQFCKKKYGKPGLTEIRELHQLRDVDAPLKRLMTDLTLDKHILGEVMSKQAPKPAQRRVLAGQIKDRFEVATVRLAGRRDSRAPGSAARARPWIGRRCGCASGRQCMRGPASAIGAPTSCFNGRAGR